MSNTAKWLKNNPSGTFYGVIEENWGQNTVVANKKIKKDTHSLKMHSAITQSSKNEKVVLIDGFEGAIRLFYVK